MKIVERFYRRLNEYLGYRYSQANVSDESLPPELYLLKKGIQGSFLALGKKGADLSLCTILTEICSIMRKHFHQLMMKMLYLAKINKISEDVVVSLSQLITKNEHLVIKEESEEKINSHPIRLFEE